MVNNPKLEKLKHTFPQLTEQNQQYVLGIAKGLNLIQGKLKESPRAEKKTAVIRRELKAKEGCG